MKIKYEFSDGNIVELEVSEDVGVFINDSIRKERNLIRKERRHCYSLDALEYGDKDVFAVSSEETPETEAVHKEEKQMLSLALDKLTETQKRRILMLAEGMSIREIARKEGVHHSSVEETIVCAKKILKKFT